jgi:AcrR family transcriptional regulator
VPEQPLRPSLRAEQVLQTRSALIAAGRRRFGRQGFAATSVEDVAREARVTTGALYHHFPNKTALFETVFQQIHTELLEASAQASAQATDEREILVGGVEGFLDAVLEPDVQQILIVDAPAVLGLARFTELDERGAVEVIVSLLQSATEAGRMSVQDPETMARLLLGALTRGGMLIASSSDPQATHDAVARAIQAMLAGLATESAAR